MALITARQRVLPLLAVVAFALVVSACSPSTTEPPPTTASDTTAIVATTEAGFILRLAYMHQDAQFFGHITT